MKSLRTNLWLTILVYALAAAPLHAGDGVGDEYAPGPKAPNRFVSRAKDAYVAAYGRFIGIVNSEYAQRAKRGAGRAMQTRTCRLTLAGLAASAVLTVGSVAYYNWDYADGKWSGQGTAATPEVPNKFFVVERSPTFSFTEGDLWVNDGKHSYGRVFLRNERIEYMHGADMVAVTNFLNPWGRPYDKDIPMTTEIFDGAGKVIGSVDEMSEEADGVHTVVFFIKDANGSIIGSTDSFREDDQANQMDGAWAVAVTTGDQEKVLNVSRGGMFTNSYTWEQQTVAERPADPRLLVVLSAYKNLVDAHRGKSP